MSEDNQAELTNSQLYSIVRQYFQTSASMDPVQQESIKVVQGLLERIPAERADDFIFSYAEKGQVVEMRVEALESTLYIASSKDKRNSTSVQLYLQAKASAARDDISCTVHPHDGKGTRKWARTTLEKVCKALSVGEYAVQDA